MKYSETYTGKLKFYYGLALEFDYHKKILSLYCCVPVSFKHIFNKYSSGHQIMIDLFDNRSADEITLYFGRTKKSKIIKKGFFKYKKMDEITKKDTRCRFCKNEIISKINLQNIKNIYTLGGIEAVLNFMESL